VAALSISRVTQEGLADAIPRLDAAQFREHEIDISHSKVLHWARSMLRKPERGFYCLHIRKPHRWEWPTLRLRGRLNTEVDCLAGGTIRGARDAKPWRRWNAPTGGARAGLEDGLRPLDLEVEAEHERAGQPVRAGAIQAASQVALRAASAQQAGSPLIQSDHRSVD
jgi:hypothetical protein